MGKQIFVVLAWSALLLSGALAQSTGPDNVVGGFNGYVTSGCAWDPITGDEHRAVTDLHVAGAVGTIPLNFTRVYDSRLQQYASVGEAESGSTILQGANIFPLATWDDNWNYALRYVSP